MITLYADVALGDLGIYFSDTDVLLLTLRGVPELSAESVVMMGTGAKWRPVKLKSIYDAMRPNKTSSSNRVSYTYWSRYQWTQNTGKAKTYILLDVPESFRRFDQRPLWFWGWNVSVRSGAMWLWTGPVSYPPSYLMQVRWHMCKQLCKCETAEYTCTNILDKEG